MNSALHFQENDVLHKIFSKIFFSGPFAGFYDIKPLNCNRMDHFKIFLLQFIFFSKNAATSGGWMAQFQYSSPLGGSPF